MYLSLRVAVAVVLGVLVASCGGKEASSGGREDGPQSTPTTASAEPFDLTAWRAEWDSARQAYADSLGAFANQLEFLVDKNATEQQLAQALQRLSGDVASEAAKFVAAVDAAGDVPEDRVDVTIAVDNLRAALEQQAQAFQQVADCGPRPKCQNDRFAAVQAGQGAVGEALKLIPKS